MKSAEENTVIAVRPGNVVDNIADCANDEDAEEVTCHYDVACFFCSSMTFFRLMV